MRIPLPARIANAPELLPGLDLYYEGFRVLHSCRGEGAIPWTVMREYCEEYGIEGEQRFCFFELLGHMDEAYFKFRNAKLEAERKK
jgi:hypothetical protein